MNFDEVVYARRTIRRFKQDPIELVTLKKLIDYARVAPMPSNTQNIEYMIIIDPEIRKKLFPLVRWAGALPKKMQTPEEGRRPVAYIIILRNLNISKGGEYGIGAAAQNILLGAANMGIGTCWMGAIDRKNIQSLLNIPKHYEIVHVISLGIPDEKSQIEEYKDSFKYWKDENGAMHVPKRNLDDIIFTQN